MDQKAGACSQLMFPKQDHTEQDSAPQQSSSDSMSSGWMDSGVRDTDLIASEDALSNGTCEAGIIVALQHPGDGGDVTAGSEHQSLDNDGMSEFSNSGLSMPEVCISTNNKSSEDDVNYEVQQAFRIFTGFLLDKHKGITSSFLHPIGCHDTQHGVGGAQGRAQSQLRQSMCLWRIEEKFVNKEYETITAFVADFRLMLENCYRYHGVDHWISKQAQKLEIMLEQKLTLLSRTLREKTTLAVTSKGRFGVEEDRGLGGTSTRRRLAPRSLATITVGGDESVMVQTLRLEEQQRAKEEKRQRELEKKEAEEMSAKEVEEWEQNLLSQASPQTVVTLWELPAIGHFLCLAQTALNLPEIVFFELERCLLMPRCSLLLSKIMSSLLSPAQRRATLHRRPPLLYRRWESELRQRVAGWYRAVGAAHDQPHRAELLGLCYQFFSILGEVNPLEEKPFHLLHFYQRVWLLKGLCDHVYETQKDVQDAVLAQPIHECRESILGYDSKENTYIHFPHFCGADLRIYCQSPSTPPVFPFPSVYVKRVETEQGSDSKESDGIKKEGDKNDRTCYTTPMERRESGDFGKRTINTLWIFKEEDKNGDEDRKRFKSWSMIKDEMSDSGSFDGNSYEDSKLDLKICSNSLSITHRSRIGGSDVKVNFKDEIVEQLSKQEQAFSLGSERTIKAETQDPCLNVGEHSYTGRSPARAVTLDSQTKPLGLEMTEESPSQEHQISACLECHKGKISHAKSAALVCCCATSELPTQVSSQSSIKETANDKMWTKKKKRKKRQTREQLLRVKRDGKHLQYVDRMRLFPAEAAKSATCKVASTAKKKDKKKKHKTGKKLESLRKMKDEDKAPPEPSFKLVCTNLDELRELISKTEDELDDLESTKKRLGRWYYKREAVKDLHSTLIRLLNELSPWEPKLVKAHQRNRLRLKKEFDDFKKQPEYNDFQREECASSSSSDDTYDDEGKDFEKDHCGGSEEDDLEHIVPRGLWSGASTREFGAESAAEKMATCIPPNYPKHLLASSEKGIGLLPRDVRTNITSDDLRGDFGSEPIPANQPRGLAQAAGMFAHTLVSPSPILSPTSGLPKSYTPIPTLLAKSVGNKVTLMKRPTDFPTESSGDGPTKGSVVSLYTSALNNSKSPKAQSSPSSSQQNWEQLVTQRPQQTQVLGQQRVAKAALTKTQQATPAQTEPKHPVQVAYNVPEGLGHLIRRDHTSPVKMSVNSVVDQNSVEKVMEPVVILPSNLLIQSSEGKVTSSNQQSKGIQVAVSKVVTPVCISTDVPGFSIPENKIPVQQVAPLKDARDGRPLPVPVSPHLQQGALKTAKCKGAQDGSVPVGTPQGGMPLPSSITYLSSAVPTMTVKSPDPKQELKTVCIRDSQSILVTTRGGNTGIVKVQTCPDQNALGTFPTSPVITISPQFKAFLVSKTSQTLSASAPSQTSPSTVPAVTSMSGAQPQKQSPWVSKASSTVTNSMLTCSIPVAGQGSQTAGCTVATSQSSNISAGSTVETKISQMVQKATASSPFPALRFNNTVTGVPSVNCPGISQVLTQEFICKTGVKRASTDEQSQVTKYILVTPSSSSTSSVSTVKGTSSTTKVVPSSRIMFISQPTAPSSAHITGSVPKQAMATGNSRQTLTSSLSSQSVRMGLSLIQPVASVSSEALPKVKTSTLPTGVQSQLSGKTTTIGQNIGVLSHSLSTSSVPSVSETRPTTAAAAGIVPVSNLRTVASSPQFGPHSSLTTHSPLVGMPSISVISQTSCVTSSSAPATMFAGNINRMDVVTPPTTQSNSSPVQVTTAVRSSPVQTSTPGLDSRPSYVKSGIREEGDSLLSSQLACNKTQIPFSSSPTTPTTGTVQQRIIINTSTPLAAGTQFLLNNARFVVPPQGLGPGSHVLIISSPAPQVPSASPTSTGASAPPKGVNHANVTVRAPVLPQSPARLPGVSALSSPFVACSPAIDPSLLTTSPHVTPFRLTGTASLGSAVIPSKTNVVSALPRLPPAHTGNFALPPVSTSILGSSQPRVGSVPTLVSPVLTGAPLFSSALPTIRVAAGTATQTECSSPKPSAVASSLPKLCRPISLLPVIPSTSAGALHNPILQVPASVSSAAASVVSDKPALHCSLPAQQVLAVTTLASSIQSQQMMVRVSTPSCVHPKGSVHPGSGNVPVIQPVLASARTQVLPTVAVPPIVNVLSRTQTLPIATVPPIGSTVSTFETAAVTSASSSSIPLMTTPAQPIPSLMSKKTTHPPDTLTKHFGQSSALGMHTNVTSKLLISPDGAVLSTVQCQVDPAELTAGPKLNALATSSSSATGPLVTHDSTLQPPQTNRVNQLNNTKPPM